jgi:uncharacterized MAPEG superfamily protein
MTVELWCAVALAVLSYPISQLPVLGKLRSGGLQWGVGNRDQEPAGLPAWVGRAERAFANHKENLLVFVVVVLTAHAAGVTDDVTRAAALTYVGARLLYVAVYLAGVTWLRTVLYYAGVLAVLAIAARLLG